MQPLLQWEKKQIVLHITRPRVCSLMYLACSAHVPYCHLWCAGLYNIFAHYLINGTVFGEKRLLNIKCANFYFIHSSVSNISHPKKN